MFNWIIIKYKSGANPYIVKTEKEFKRIMRKYKDNIKTIAQNEHNQEYFRTFYNILQRI